jgi:hypothetical protein
VALDDMTFYVAIVHSSNTSPKPHSGRNWSRWSGDLQALLGDDLTNYRPEGPAAPTEARIIASDPPRQPTPLTAPGEPPMRLNLGCCDALLPDYVNVDLVPGPGVTVADLTRPWPWPDGSAAHVRAWDIIEHLPDKIQTMNELWRVLCHRGTAEIAVPTTDGSGAFQDPTHVSFWNRRSFMYYEAGNPYHERCAQAYGISARFRIIGERTDHSQDGPRLTIELEAVKG